MNLKGRENEFRNFAIELIRRFQNDVGEVLLFVCVCFMIIEIESQSNFLFLLVISILNTRVDIYANGTFRASPMECQIYTLMLKFSIKHEKSSPILCYFVCQIWHMLYLVPNLVHKYSIMSNYGIYILHEFFYFFIYKTVIL